MKICKKCNLKKDLSEYGIHKSTKDKLQTFCKACISLNRKKFKEKNPNWDKEHYSLNKEHYKKKSINRYKENKKIILSKQKEYYIKNKEYILNYYKTWVSLNKLKIKEYTKNRKKDPKIRLSCILRAQISRGLKEFNGIKYKKTLDIIGMSSWEEFKKYIESQWSEGMSWENYGIGSNNTTWHIDHKTPLFSASSLEEIYKLNHYSNLGPMWGSDNIRKGKTIFED